MGIKEQLDKSLNADEAKALALSFGITARTKADAILAMASDVPEDKLIAAIAAQVVAQAPPAPPPPPLPGTGSQNKPRFSIRGFERSAYKSQEAVNVRSSSDFSCTYNGLQVALKRMEDYTLPMCVAKHVKTCVERGGGAVTIKE